MGVNVTSAARPTLVRGSMVVEVLGLPAPMTRPALIAAGVPS